MHGVSSEGRKVLTIHSAVAGLERSLVVTRVTTGLHEKRTRKERASAVRLLRAELLSWAAAAQGLGVGKEWFTGRGRITVRPLNKRLCENLAIT